MDTKNQKSKSKNQIKSRNVLEAINEIGSQTVNTLASESKAVGEEFFKQLLGRQRETQQKKSGELSAGRPLNVNEAISGKTEKDQKLENQLFFERRLFSEEKQSSEKKLNELRLRLHAVQSEAMQLVESTHSLGEEIKIAVIQQVTNVSEYQINFFDDIIKSIISFKKKIDSAVTWLQGQSKRAQKMNYWNQYKKKGASFLLSGETYSQRSAG